MGFESINKYTIGNFSNIKEKLISEKEQDKYCQKWLENYSRIFKNSNSLEIIEWRVREWRAIKEIYASAILFEEAKFALKNRCMASYYFSLYYSLFHAMLSSICLDNTITLDQISDINHSKLVNQFKNTYCHGKNAILSEDIYTIFNKFKYLREYYSYIPPLNMSLYEDTHSDSIKELITKCYQITNLQSLILEKSSRHCNIIKIDSDEKYERVMNSFIKLVSKPNIDNKYVFDEADKNIISETLRDGAGFQFIALQLDHTFDEFRCYNGSGQFFGSENGIKTGSIYSFIYESIV